MSQKKKKIKGGSVGGSEVQCQAQNIMVGMGWRNRKKKLKSMKRAKGLFLSVVLKE